MSNDWNVSKNESSGLLSKNERAIIIGLITGKDDEKVINDYLIELEFLASTAGAITVQRFTQKSARPDKRYYIGSGKVEEIGLFIEDNDIDLVIFDDDLSPSQSQNLEKVLKRKIIDRSNLILDIFASHARTAQAKTQVELAQMQYLLPRLRGLWTHLERQKGGIGMRGPGEKEIETDRRIVRDKIARLKEKLSKIELQNETQRKNRGEFIRVALVGYTNVGKSTIMNRLSKSDVLAENKLFATLDTTVRKVVFGRMPFLMSDTVGFIRKLPHHLIESFKSTLDEAKESDILLHVIDVSHDKYEEHIATVTETLRNLGVVEKPILMIFNKLDLYRGQAFDELLTEEEKIIIEQEFKESLQKQYEHPMVFVSAHTSENINELRDTLQKMIEENYQERYPYITKYW